MARPADERVRILRRRTSLDLLLAVAASEDKAVDTEGFGGVPVSAATPLKT
eukprot:CAMPEP_0194314670 /NCGR_PEP_ID=MMETSP0171-20130528/11523_1 /TAXON_ID=218684 /ORGANISM="Corethron pennatum, Strain L29A3" /LENGTH=50 /DNA_ID=CAMNT_0039070199 /DNA_START=1608 /DNA_END=1760 /DNA_ORIENTATION=+